MNRSIRRSMCAAMLALQAVVLFLVGLVLSGLTDLGFGTAFGIGLGLAVLCVLAAGMLRRPVGYWLGWAVQGLSIALGFVVPMMFFVGVLFASLWAGAYYLGAQIDRERAEREATEHP